MSTAFGERHPWLGSVGRFVIKQPRAVLIACQIVAFLAIPGAIFFMPNTTSSVDPPTESISWEAREKMRYHFPLVGNRAEFVVVVALKDTYDLDGDDSGASLLESFFEHSTADDMVGCTYGEVGCIHQRHWRQGNNWPPLLGEFKGALLATKASIKKESRRDTNTTATAPILQLPGLADFTFALRKSLNKLHHLSDFTSNSTLWYEEGIPAPRSLLSPDGRATIIFWRLKEHPIGDTAKEFYVDAQDVFENKVRTFLPEQEVRAVIYAGAGVANTALRDVEKTFLMMDVTSLPIALGVLLYVLESPRLFLFPVALMGSSLIISFGLMFLVSQFKEIMSTTPTLMMNIIIAMSVDYSLFFLCRFRQEIHKSTIEDVKEKFETAVITTLETAGFAIFISGSTLCISFFVLAMMPSPTIQTLGIGCTIAIILMVTFALTLGPAVMLVFADFLEPGLRPSGNGAEAESSFWKGVWRRLVKFQSNPVRGAITVALITGATIAIGFPWYDVRVTATFDTVVPHNSDAFKAAKLLRKEFGAGAAEQFRILMILKDGHDENATSILAPGPWEDSQRLLRTMASNLPYTQGLTIEGLSYSLYDDVEKPTPWQAVAGCVAQAEMPAVPACKLVAHGVQTYVSEGHEAMYASLIMRKDPSSFEGREFTKRARDIVEKLQPTMAFKTYISGHGPEAADTVDKVIDLTPAVMLATMSLAFILYGVCFHSIAIPLRSVTSIALTMVWCFGLAVRVYQQDMFHWLAWAPLRDTHQSQHYLAPVTSFSIVTGLCLDYDIFLLTRVTELRAEGMTTRQAIEEGVVSTGSIITAAGVIMFTTFTGLIYCTTTQVVNILGFYLSTAVLFDTFIIRATIVPATMFMLDRYEWWPSELSRKMPCDEEPRGSEG